MSDKENYDDELHAMLQGLPQPEPSAELDQAILAQAEQELSAGKAANDAHYLFFKNSFVRRYRVPLGLAATVLIAANLALMEPVERQVPQPEAAVMMEVPLLPPPKVANTPQQPPEIVAEAPPMAAAAPAPAVEMRPAPPAIVESAPRAAEKSPPPPMVAIPAAPPAGATAAAPAARDEALARSQAAFKEEMSKTRSVPMTQSLADTPEAALQRIFTLEKHGDPAQAAMAWQAFRRTYPAYAVDDTVRARLDALPVPPTED